MGNILRIFADDVRLAASSIISILVLVGVCLAPGLYAWFNIAANWSPNDNDAELKIAIANSDQGYTGEFVPAGINLGDKVVSALHEDASYGWQFVNESEAVEGVKAGRYYAAIVIPSDFSSKLMTAFSTNVESAQATYYVNSKANPSAPALAVEDGALVAEGINDAFTNAVDVAMVSLVADVASIAEGDELQSFVSLLIARLETVADGLNATSGQVRAYASLVDAASSLTSSAATALEGSGSSAESANSAIGSASSQIMSAISSINDAITAFDGSLTDDQRNYLERVSNGAVAELSTDASSLGDSAKTTAEDAARVAASLTTNISHLSGSGKSLSAKLEKVHKRLDKAAESFDNSADEIRALSDDIVAALDQGDMTKLSELVGRSMDASSNLSAAPVVLEDHAVYPVEPYGSSMAPLLTALALWAGAVILVCVMRTDVSEERTRAMQRRSIERKMQGRYVSPKDVKKYSVKNHQMYIGRFLLFAVVALVQATVVWAGDVFVLGIQCAHPALLLVACWACSFVFCNIAFTLVATFGSVGKALCVVMLAVQLIGAGDGYPVQMTGDVFQAIHQFMPLTHGVDAMREAIAGLYGNNFIFDLAKVNLFLAPSLLVGLALRTPLMDLMDYLDEVLSETGVM